MSSLLLLAALSLRVSSLDVTRRRLARLARTLRIRETPATIAARLNRAQRRLPWRTTCLHAAIAGEAALRASGIPCELRIGARREAGSERPAFHAWLEHDGQVLIGATVSSYNILRSA